MFSMELIFCDDNKVTPFHIKTSVESYQRQVALAQKKDVTETPAERLVRTIREVLDVNDLDKLETMLQMMEYQWDEERDHYNKKN